MIAIVPQTAKIKMAARTQVTSLRFTLLSGSFVFAHKCFLMRRNLEGSKKYAPDASPGGSRSVLSRGVHPKVHVSIRISSRLVRIKGKIEQYVISRLVQDDVYRFLPALAVGKRHGL